MRLVDSKTVGGGVAILTYQRVGHDDPPIEWHPGERRHGPDKDGPVSPPPGGPTGPVVIDDLVSVDA
jgi:hypothetical protein